MDTTCAGCTTARAVNKLSLFYMAGGQHIEGNECDRTDGRGNQDMVQESFCSIVHTWGHTQQPQHASRHGSRKKAMPRQDAIQRTKIPHLRQYDASIDMYRGLHCNTLGIVRSDAVLSQRSELILFGDYALKTRLDHHIAGATPYRQVLSHPYQYQRVLRKKHRAVH